MAVITPIERAVGTYFAGWEKAKANQDGIAKVNPETLCKSTPGALVFRYIDIGSVNKGVVDWETVQTLRFADAPSRARRVVRPGDILISTVRPMLMSHAFADWDSQDTYVCSTGFAVIRSDGGINPRFLRHLPFAEQVTRQLAAWQCGTNYPAVNESDIRSLMLPIPPPEEQEVIARTLDAVETAIKQTQSAIALARVLKSSLIHRLLCVGVRNESLRKSDAGPIPQSWDCEKLDKHIEDGPTNGVYRHESDYCARGTPIVRIDSFDYGRIHDVASLRRVKVEPAIERRYALREGDLLINRVNSLSHIGKAAYVPKLGEPTIFESNMMSLHCGDRLLPEFLILVLCSDIARRHWLARAKPAVNQASINQRDVKELSIPVPLKDEQSEIVRIVSAADEYADELETVVALQETIKKALMHDLLTGKVRVNNANLNSSGSNS